MLSTFNTGPIRASLTHHGSNFGNVVSARYGSCEEPVSFVTYATVGSDYIITSFGVHPWASQKEAQLAGRRDGRGLGAGSPEARHQETSDCASRSPGQGRRS